MSVLICQMPFQLKAVLPFLKAMKSASWAILPGECPFLTRSTNQVIALTPGSSAQVACVASSVNSVAAELPEQRLDGEPPVNGNGVAQWPWMPLLFSASSAAAYSSAVVGGFSGSRPAFSMTALL